MKGKIIRGFLAVYLALSMAYGGIRAAYFTVTAAITPPEKAEDQIEMAAPSSFGIDTVPAEPKQEAEVIPSHSVQPRETPSIIPEVTPDPSPVAEPEEPASALEETQEDSSLEEEIEAPASEAEGETPEDSGEWTEAPEEAEPEEEEAYLEAAPAQDVPSLEEYLSQLHCGRCGRNCYLSNPRCRTGRNKAESETAVYYETYGYSDEI